MIITKILKKIFMPKATKPVRTHAKARPAVKSKVAASGAGHKTAAHRTATQRTAIHSTAPRRKKLTAQQLLQKKSETGIHPADFESDPAHSVGHRKINWKKYQETQKFSKKSARP